MEMSKISTQYEPVRKRITLFLEIKRIINYYDYYLIIRIYIYIFDSFYILHRGNTCDSKIFIAVLDMK
jgi:hypothetical protein